jgi:hypothetical protein
LRTAAPEWSDEREIDGRTLVTFGGGRVSDPAIRCIELQQQAPDHSGGLAMGLLDKVKDVAGKAADQAKHGLAVGKEKIEDTKLKKQIEDLLQEIGELVVLTRRSDAPEDVDAQIDAKIAKIDELEAAIDANDVAKPEPAPEA